MLFALDRDGDGGCSLAVLVVCCLSLLLPRPHRTSLSDDEYAWKSGSSGDVFARKGVLSAWGTPYTALSKNKEEVAKMTQ